MIEPLRFCHEAAVPMVVRRPIFCGGCLKKKTMRKDPNVAIKHCDSCFEQTKKFLCATCDDEEHRLGPRKDHLRRLVVIGAGVRKKVISRGDGVFFPLPMDRVNIKLQCRVYHQGKMIKKLKQTKMNYMVGLSGECVHVQVLGAKNITAADMNGRSDPYMVALFQGKKLGITRIKNGTVNPRWKSETFIVPMADNLPDSRNMSRSAKGLFKLEVYDYDFIGANDFLGHFEIHKDRLKRLAVASKAQPLLFPLTTKEFHGIVGLQMGLSQSHFALKVTRAENLDKYNPFADGKPFMKVYFGDEYLGATSWEFDGGQVSWDGPRSRSEFRLPINTVLRRERTLVKRRKSIEEIIRIKSEKTEKKKRERRLKRKLMSSKKLTHEEERMLEEMKSASRKAGEAEEEVKDIENEPVDLGTELEDYENADVMFRLEIFEYNFIRAPSFLGEFKVAVGDIRKMCPQLPVRLQDVKDPPSPLDRQIEQQRHQLNGGGCCKGAAVDLSDDTDPEEDDDWWRKEFGEEGSIDALDDDDPVLKALADAAEAKAGGSEQEASDGRSVGSIGEASASPLPHADRPNEQGSPDSVKEMMMASTEAGRGMLTEENLSDPHRRLRSPGPPERKTLATTKANSASPSNDDSSFRTEDEGGTDVEGGDSDGGGFGVLSASPLMQEQRLGSEIVREGEQGAENRRQVLQLNRSHPKSVFNLSAIANSLDDMTFSVDAALGPGGEKDAHELYRGLSGDPDLLELGGSVYQGTDLLLDPLSGIATGANSRVEIEENGFEDDAEDPRTLLLGHPSTEETNPAGGTSGPWGEGANNSIMPTDQQLVDSMVDVTEQQFEQQIVQEEDRVSETASQRSRATGVSITSRHSKGSTTDDAQLGTRKRDRKSKRAKPPSVDDESKEEGAEKYQLLSADGPSPLKDSIGSGVDDSSLDSKFDPDALIFGNVRHYHVHRESEKQVEGARKSDGGAEDLGHVILRLLPSNRGNVIAGLDEGVRHMSLGETADIKIRFDHAYSSFAMTEYIPARANLVFTVKLKAINGFGLAGLPLRMVKRVYRFTTFACRKTGDFVRHVYRDAKKKKRVRRLCSWLYSFIKKAPTEEFSDEGDDNVMELEEQSVGEDSDEEEVRPLTIKADASMRKHLTPAVHAGAKYFWNYKPHLRPKKNKKKQLKRDEENADRDSDDSRSDVDGDLLEDIEEDDYEGDGGLEDAVEGTEELSQQDTGVATGVQNKVKDENKEQDLVEAGVLEQAAPPEESVYKGIKDKPPPDARSGRRPAPPK